MKRAAVIASIIAMAVAFMLMSIGCGSDRQDADKREIKDVYATEKEVEYDGRRHGIEVNNIIATDEVYYSETGTEWSKTAIEYSEVGEYEIYFKVVRKGYEDFVSSGKIKIYKAVLQGISAERKTVVYDGREHGIEIIGTEENDGIKYSEDGSEYRAALTKKDVGRYTVYFVVERANGEYFGSTELLILPEIRGRYWNALKGEIEIKDTNYDETGRGMIGENEYVVKDSTLEIGDTEYKYVKDDEQVYKFTINGGEIFYTIGKRENETAEIRVYESEERAEIIIGGIAVKEVTGVNYSENGNTMTLTEKDIDITLKKLPENPQGDIYELVIFDGLPHKHSGIENSNEYTEIGRHEDKITLVEEGYLPKEINAVLEIVKNITGNYCNADNIIEINMDIAMINGESNKMEYFDGAWRVAGKELSEENGKLYYDGREYFKASKNIVDIIYGGETLKIKCDADDVLIVCDSGTLTVTIDGVTVSKKEVDSSIITVNGERKDGIVDGSVTMYVLGSSDLTGVIRVEIVVAE